MKPPSGSIQGRRAELGFTRAQLAREARLHTGVVAKIEASDDLTDLSLGQIRTLEATLGIDLLGASQATTSFDFERELGAIIADGRLTGLPIEAAAHVLECDLRDAYAGIKRVREQLEAAGMTLVGSPGKVPSISKDFDAVLDGAIDREASRHLEDDLSDDELRMILRVAAVHGSQDRLHIDYLTGPEAQIVGGLTARGYLVTVNQRIHLTDRTAESLRPILDLQEARAAAAPTHWAGQFDPGERFAFVPSAPN